MKGTDEKPYVVGLDLGGTNSVFGIVDGEGKILVKTSIKTKGHPDVNDYVTEGCNALNAIIEQVGGKDKIKGMGIGAPNGNFYTGNIEFAANLEWKGIIPLANLFQEKMGFPVALTNDANAAAIGEMKYGCARGMKNFIMITLGTGVGSGIVVNGQLVYGCDGFAGELGHTVVIRGLHERGRLCGCGRYGCLETYCSATGVARTAREMLAESTDDSLLRNIAPENITSLDVAIAAGKGDHIAQAIFEFTGNLLGEACADFTNFCSPEAYIFFGGLVNAGDLIMEPIKRSYDEHVLKSFRGKAKMLVSALNGADAAVLGASALGWEAK